MIRVPKLNTIYDDRAKSREQHWSDHFQSQASFFLDLLRLSTPRWQPILIPDFPVFIRGEGKCFYNSADTRLPPLVPILIRSSGISPPSWIGQQIPEKVSNSFREGNAVFGLSRFTKNSPKLRWSFRFQRKVREGGGNIVAFAVTTSLLKTLLGFVSLTLVNLLFIFCYLRLSTPMNNL